MAQPGPRPGRWMEKPEEVTSVESPEVDFFQHNLTSLEANWRNLSHALHAFSNDFFRLKEVLWSDRFLTEEKSNYMVAFKNSQEKKVEVRDLTVVCLQRKKALESLIEEGFDDRHWSFRTVT